MTESRVCQDVEAQTENSGQCKEEEIMNQNRYHCRCLLVDRKGLKVEAALLASQLLLQVGAIYGLSGNLMGKFLVTSFI